MSHPDISITGRKETKKKITSWLPTTMTKHLPPKHHPFLRDGNFCKCPNHIMAVFTHKAISMRLQGNLHRNKLQDNMPMSAILTLWELLIQSVRPSPFIMNGRDKLPWLPTDFITQSHTITLALKCDIHMADMPPLCHSMFWHLSLASFTKDCVSFQHQPTVFLILNVPEFNRNLKQKYIVVNIHLHFTYANDFQQLPNTTKIQQNRNNYASNHVNKQTVIQNLPFATRNSSSYTPGGGELTHLREDSLESFECCKFALISLHCTCMEIR